MLHGSVNNKNDIQMHYAKKIKVANHLSLLLECKK